jgi:cytochrome c oxidase subunit IV
METVKYSVYWRTWIVLLVLTTIMILVDQAGMPREILVGILLAAMLAKATLIAANFMHLKYEKLAVGIAVGVSLLFVGAILFLLMVPDGLRMLRMGG